MITVIATELANAVAIDNDHPDGHDISAGMFGTAVSALIRKRVDEYTSLAAERDAAHRLNGDQVASNLGLRVRMAALEALLGRAATAMQHLGCRQDDPLLTEIRASCQTQTESKQRPLNADERATVEKYLADVTCSECHCPKSNHRPGCSQANKEALMDKNVSNSQFPAPALPVPPELEPRTEEMLDGVDAAVFSGDAFFTAEAIARFRWYLGRWERACAERLKDLEENPVNTADEPL